MISPTTRSRTGELLPFKKGGFLMAIKAQAPIVPVAVSGGRAAMRKGSAVVRPVMVTVRIGKPIPTAGLTLEDRDVLIERCRFDKAGQRAVNIGGSTGLAYFRAGLYYARGPKPKDSERPA